MPLVRCFVGIALPRSVTSVLIRAGKAVALADPKWTAARWVDERNLHVTLKFIGNVDDSIVADLAAAIGTALPGIGPVVLGLEGLSAKPSATAARMLWATFRDVTGGAGSAAEAVDRATSRFSSARETRRFTPHATLCRTKRPINLADKATLAASDVIHAQDLLVSDPTCNLYSSRLTPRGPVYTVLGTWSLRGE